MSKLSKEQIAARRKRMQDEALRSVAKTEQLNIRIDEDSISRLYSLAAKQAKPVGTMVREWIVERIDSEETTGGATSMMTLIDLIATLNYKVDRWDQLMVVEEAVSVGHQATEVLRANAEEQYLELAS